MARIALLDVDGTLVDTNYHHAVAWFRAFRGVDVTLPLWRLHRHLGMGGDQFVAAVAGDEVEQRKGDWLREEWKRQYDRLLPEIQPAAGAQAFLGQLRQEGWRTVLATSGAPEHTDYYIDLLDARDLLDGWTTAADVEATKPSPAVVQAALAKVGGGDAVLVGDSTWDVEAGKRAGVPTICVLTGGFSEHELCEAGSAAVFPSLTELAANWRDVWAAAIAAEPAR
jgi:HAD superfamily hydrolase (TIGR01509 family)